jgi:hypothetical protein
MVRRYVWTDTQPAIKPGLCQFCGDIIEQGTNLAILRYGNDREDWTKAHVSCASADPEIADFGGAEKLLAARPAKGVIARYVKLPKGEYKGANCYQIFIREQPVSAISVERSASAICEFINTYPNKW